MKKKEFKSWIGKNPGRRKKEFNLSEKEREVLFNCKSGEFLIKAYFTDDIKEAVRLLKEGLKYTAYVDERIELVNKIFGDKLI